MSAARWHISVVIPARNEEAFLPRCLDSVLMARAALLHMATCDVVVVADRSTDATHRLASTMLRGVGAVVTSQAGIVGVARAAGVAAALRRARCEPDRIWFANTDADCVVPRDWLVEQIAFAEGGAQAVAGIVDVDSFAEHSPWVPERFRATYTLHDDGTHPHVHGANLGVRGDAYLSAGGWGSLGTAEDHDLWGRLGAIGAFRISSSALSVVTSGRRIGRAPLGFAGALAAHNEVALEL